MEYDFVVGTLRTALSSDSSVNTHSMNADVGSPDDIENYFDNIAYNKGIVSSVDVCDDMTENIC